MNCNFTLKFINLWRTQREKTKQCEPKHAAPSKTPGKGQWGPRTTLRCAHIFIVMTFSARKFVAQPPHVMECFAPGLAAPQQISPGHLHGTHAAKCQDELRCRRPCLRPKFSEFRLAWPKRLKDSWTLIACAPMWDRKWTAWGKLNLNLNLNLTLI